MAKLKKKDLQSELFNLLNINIAIFILLLSFFNINQKREASVQVLGTKTENTFWIDFVAKHPTYRDGWIELGRLDKVKEIDPNYGRLK